MGIIRIAVSPGVTIGLLEFWTHDERQATAALSRGFTVSGVDPDGSAGSAHPFEG